MIRAALLATFLLVMLSGCMASFKRTCSNIGYAEGTQAHAACVEREIERFGAAMQGMSHSLQESNRQMQQQQYQQQQNFYQQQMLHQMQRPRTCYGSRYSVTCY